LSNKKAKNMKNQIINRLLDGAIVATLLAAVTQTATAVGPPLGTTPDATSTSILMGVACAGLAVIRRFRR
jgi:hypothetical protein